MSENFSPDVCSLIENAINSKIEDFTVEVSQNTKGQGFVGEVLYVTLSNKKLKKNIYLVVKQQILFKGAPLEFSNLPFINEIYFYDVLWPNLNKFYHERTGLSLDFIPKCLGVSNDVQKKLIMENLKESGFTTFDKTKPFDETHFFKVFNTYGIYHGISMALKEIDNEKFLELVQGTTNIWREMLTGQDLMSKGLIYRVRKDQKLFDSNSEQHFINKLKEYEDIGIKKVHKALTEDAVPRVITHGDCWSNNMMFKYDEEGHLEGIKLIDFQFTHTASPAQDLSYCFYSSGSKRDFDRLDHYLQIYHSSLSETLKNFGLNAENIYPYNNLKEEWKCYSKFGFVMALMTRRAKLADPNKIPTISDVLEDENYKSTESIDTDKIPDFLLTDDNEMEYRQQIRDMVIHMYNNNFI